MIDGKLRFCELFHLLPIRIVEDLFGAMIYFGSEKREGMVFKEAGRGCFRNLVEKRMAFLVLLVCFIFLVNLVLTLHCICFLKMSLA